MALAVLLACGAGVGAQSVLVEAESFENAGGWVVDQQFIGLMGSPYLLAHGLGEPVKDAVTTATFPAAGTYRVWVRTLDWVAKWQAPGTPGRFRVLVGGRPLTTLFGTQGPDWHWQDGGTVRVSAGRIPIALQDLTGFEGRCDAVLFTRDQGFVPPNRGEALAAFRKQVLGLLDRPEEAGRFDLVVVGGGIAGICAAVSAARLGLQVALIQDRPVLGGNNSSEVRVWLGGHVNFPPHPRIGNLVMELDPQTKECPAPAAAYGDEQKLKVVQAERNVSLFLNHHVDRVEMEGGRIAAVMAVNTRTSRRLRFGGRWFADCTGDGTVGFLAGAVSEMTLEGHMGPTNQWRVVDTGHPAPFPRCPWALDLSGKAFPSQLGELGKWFWESGFDRHPINDMEYIRDYNLRAMYGAWDCLKNARRLYPHHRLEWAAYVAGKRESRRLLGDVLLTKDDLRRGREFPDGCFPTSWAIDLHLPHKQYEKGFEGEAFISTAHFTHYKRPYWVPYRCLYSRSVPNLFMAGRDISVTHDALGSVRVQRTTGMMGEVVGMAASLCKQHDTDPRGVYDEHLDALKALLSKGVGRPPDPTRAPRLTNTGFTRATPVKLAPVDPSWGTNLAPQARATASGDRDPAQYPLKNVNDGAADVADNGGRWLSRAGVPHWVELAWDTPRTLRAARIVSGYSGGGGTADPIEEFELQYHDGAEWRQIPEARTTGNTDVDWRRQFRPITTQRIRLWVTRTKLDISRIYEIELYGGEGAK